MKREEIKLLMKEAQKELLVLHVLSSFQGNKKISMEPFDEQ
jgi:hypothetical protein